MTKSKNFFDWLYLWDFGQLVWLVLFSLGTVLLLGALLQGLRSKWVTLPRLSTPRFLIVAFVGVIAMVPAILTATLPNLQKNYAVAGSPESAAISTGQIANGDSCEKPEQCKSGQCYPAPAPTPEGAGKSYCMANAMNCALAKLDGARYGSVIQKDGQILACRNPGSGKAAQFVL